MYIYTSKEQYLKLQLILSPMHFCRKKRIPGPGCSKQTTYLVNVSLKFQTLIYGIRQYFLLKNCEKVLQCKNFSHFFNKKISMYLFIKS